jgi:hypothetical protein
MAVNAEPQKSLIHLLKRKKILSHATIWIKLRTMLSEISQSHTQKKSHMIPLI